MSASHALAAATATHVLPQLLLLLHGLSAGPVLAPTLPWHMGLMPCSSCSSYAPGRGLPSYKGIPYGCSQPVVQKGLQVIRCDSSHKPQLHKQPMKKSNKQAPHPALVV